jgi:hypothetical protein
MSSPNKFYNYAMATGIALGSSGVAPADAQMKQSSGTGYSWGFKTEQFDKSTRSGQPITFLGSENLRYRVAATQALSMSSEEKMRQYRYKSIERSFMKNSDGFPGTRMSYMEYMANVMCGISFLDNISAFNKIDETIDTVFKLNGGLTLTMSQFLEDEIDAPVVFSIHRGEELLVSAEMNLDELAKTVKDVLISESAANV